MDSFESVRLKDQSTMKSLAFRVLLTVTLLNIGCATPACIMSVRNAVPAYRLPIEFRTCSRQNLVPIDLNLLGQQRPPEGHRLAEGDLLGVYIGGVLPPRVDDQASILPPVAIAGNIYYPAMGRVNTPTIGVPLELRTNGTVRLPLIGLVNLQDRSLEEATEIVRTAYEKRGFLAEGRERVYLSLIRARVRRIVIMRDDAQAAFPTFVAKAAVPFTKIGRGEVIDLPVYENDVLHALGATGGLPGIDVFSEVWIFRNREANCIDPAIIQQQIQSAGSPEKFAESWVQKERQLVRIPLRVNPDQPLPFAEEDVVLNDGDVVYLPPREIEYFYTGGQLAGGKVPLPRDRDLDVMEAIAYVNGSAGGSTNDTIFHAGPGTIFPPTQALVVRKLPNGQQLRIRVDLTRALNNPNERILIQPEDQLLLFYKPKELYANLFLNYIGVSIGATYSYSQSTATIIP